MKYFITLPQLFIFILLISSVNAQEHASDKELPFEKILTSKNGKKKKFIITSYDDEKVTVVRDGKTIDIQLVALSIKDQSYFKEKKEKSIKPIAPVKKRAPNPPIKKPTQDPIAADSKLYIGEWSYSVSGQRYRRVINPDGTAELWVNRRKHIMRGGHVWEGFTWKINGKGNLVIFDRAGKFRVEYKFTDLSRSQITNVKNDYHLTKALFPWKEPTTGPLVNKDGTLRRKPAGARYSKVVDISSLGSEKLPQLVISNLNNGGKSYHAPDGSLLIEGTRGMHIRVVDAVDKNNKEVKGLEVTDKDIKKIIDDKGKTIVQLLANSSTWQVKTYDENAKLIKAILSKQLTQHFQLHLSDGRTIKIYGWIAHNFTTPDGISVYKGGKYAFISYEGKLLIPPLYEKPLKYLGNKQYQAEVNGETKTIIIK